jgi:hypothetical protein
MYTYTCSTCKHSRTYHGSGFGRCYAGGRGAAWCKCQAYDGPVPCQTCKGPHDPTVHQGRAQP